MEYRDLKRKRRAKLYKKAEEKAKAKEKAEEKEKAKAKAEEKEKAKAKAEEKGCRAIRQFCLNITITYYINGSNLHGI